MKALHLAIPIAVLTIFCTIMIFQSSEAWSVGIVIGILSLVILFSFKDSIDWKYYQKHAPTLDPKVITILSQVPFYKHLNEEGKKKFDLRLALFCMAHQYKRQRVSRESEDNELDAPDDLKAFCSISAIILTFDNEKFLIPEVEQIILYNHPFPTPWYKVLHHSEYHEEDAVLIFSVPNIRKGVFEPFKYFDISMYEWSKAIQSKSLHASWDAFTKTYGITKEQIEISIGLPDPDIESVQKVFEVHHAYLSVLS